jgi:hypothetical protein
MHTLMRTAVFALGKVRFIVAAHLRRDAGDVIPPSRQNLSNDRVNAFTHNVPPPFCEILNNL